MKLDRNARGWAEQIAQGVILLLLLVAPALFVFHQQCVSDPDIWWHLRAGEWILHHRGFPQVDPFSSLDMAPWIAYSWAFELLLYALYTHVGYLGIVIYTSSLVVAITAAIYRFVKRLQPDFTSAVLLTLAATIAMCRLYTPRPWLLTVLFFVFEIDILFAAYRDDHPQVYKRQLIFLPILFAIWANVHIQFIDGLIVLVFGAMMPALRAMLTKGSPCPIPKGDDWIRQTTKRLGVFAACLVATLLNPYGWKIYAAAWQLASQAGVLNKINELQALPFRNGGDYLVLSIAIASAVALAWRRRFDLFEVCLLVISIAISFRSQRDIWMVIIVGIGILAEASASRGSVALSASRQRPLHKVQVSIVTLMALVVVCIAGKVLRIDNRKLEIGLEASMPVKAIDFVRSHHCAGPLYNTYNWGGILIWALRIPVSLDGRAALYGDQLIDRSVQTWGGHPGWERDPDLMRSNLVLAPIDEPLTQLLMLSSDFRLAYRDKVAAVFVRRVPHQELSDGNVMAMSGMAHR